jgi:hypothetical protein
MKNTTAKRKRQSYSEEVRAVAKGVRDLLGPKVAAPGAKQVAAVVAALGDETPAKAAGLSKAKLKAWAGGDRPDDWQGIRDLSKRVGDPWATGRKLAAILVVIEGVRNTKTAKAVAA